MAFVSSSVRGSGIVDRFKALTVRMREAREKRVIYSRTIRELSRLDDRELMDLGISRYNIDEIAYQHAYGA